MQESVEFGVDAPVMHNTTGSGNYENASTGSFTSINSSMQSSEQLPSSMVAWTTPQPRLSHSDSFHSETPSAG